MEKRHRNNTPIQQRIKDSFLSFDDLYSKYFMIVIAYLSSRKGNHLLLEDMAQEVFIRFLKNKVNFHDESAFKAYIFSIAGNVLREHYRSARREKTIQKHLRNDLCSNYYSQPETLLHHQELVNTIAQAKSRLSAKQRQALDLKFYSNIPLAKAVKQADCSIKVFRQRLSDAKESLRKLLPDPIQIQ